MTTVERVAIVGAGTMGHGIAQVAALGGFTTTLTDAREDALDDALGRIRHNLEGGVTRGKVTPEQAQAALGRLIIAPDLDDAVRGAQLVIEAIVEDLDAKRALFRRLDDLIESDCVLATNTSALSVTAIAAVTRTPGRVLGMHFFNPVHIMKLVELIAPEEVSELAVAHARAVAIRMGKEPILVQDSPGFASSRLGVVLGLEAMRMVEQGVACAADIDKAMELGYGHPMGPLKVTDLVGLDVRLAIAEYLHRELQSPLYAPPAILRAKVAAGALGKKTGKGFYEWPNTKTS